MSASQLIYLPRWPHPFLSAEDPPSALAPPRRDPNYLPHYLDQEDYSVYAGNCNKILAIDPGCEAAHTCLMRDYNTRVSTTWPCDNIICASSVSGKSCCVSCQRSDAPLPAKPIRESGLA